MNDQVYEPSSECTKYPAEHCAGELASDSLPGLSGLDHVGLTVPDLEEATRFLVDVIGCEYLYSLGPLADERGAWMQTHLNVDPRAVARVRFFRCGSSPVLEVFEYTAPAQRTTPPRNSDVGGHHVALYVDDLDAGVRYLKARGVTVLGEPTASAGPHKGQRWFISSRPGVLSSNWSPTRTAARGTARTTYREAAG